MPIYVPGKVVLAQTYVGIDDPDAAAYITNVEAADTAAGQSGGLETATKVAIHSFVKGCKADGIWPAIKASCILAGARTLTGALIPLAGTAPTDVGGLFLAGDYNRKTGLVGNGTTKYLNSNRAGNADPQNSISLAAYVSTIHNPDFDPVLTPGGAYIGNGGSITGATNVGRAGGSTLATRSTFARNRNSTAQTGIGSTAPSPGLVGTNRADSFNFNVRVSQTNYPYSQASQSSSTDNHFIFARNNGSGTAESYSNGRLAFYSIGESLDLALLDTRLTTLINAFAAAIP
jgi:hypothetical protein